MKISADSEQIFSLFLNRFNIAIIFKEFGRLFQVLSSLCLTLVYLNFVLSEDIYKSSVVREMEKT